MKILHITESFGGGVTSAINSYVSNSPQFSHHLIASIRVSDSTGEEDNGNFTELKLVPRSLNSLFSLRAEIKRIQPDVIHLHSTYAGFFCRLMPFISKKKVVYTPHGFAFLRDANFILKKIYFFIEKLLSFRTEVIAGCGADEKKLGGNFLPVERTKELINVCDDIGSTQNYNFSTNKPVIAMVGRIAPQKGYSYFKQVAELVGDCAQFIWIGGGDSTIVTDLENSNIIVTGWLNRNEVIAALNSVDVYFHTAAWDGFPISVLEAAKLKKKIVLRLIGPFVAEGLHTVKTETDASIELKKIINHEPRAIEQANKNSTEIEKYHTKVNLQDSLIDLYAKFKKI